MIQTGRKINVQQGSTTQEQHRLALLWRAFEDAETRIKDLERELDQRREAQSSTMEIDERAFEREVRARYERAAEELRRDHKNGEAHRAAERASHAAEADALRRAAESNARLAESAELSLASTRAELADLREQVAEAERRVLGAQRAADVERIEHQLDVTFHVAARATMASELEIARNELSGAMLEVEDLLADRAAWIQKERAAIEQRDAALQHLAKAEEDLVERIQLATIREAQLVVEARIAAEAPIPIRSMPVQEHLYPFVLRRIREMPSVAPEEAMDLRTLGINTTDSLLYADLAAVNAATGIPMTRLGKMRALAELSSIHGIAHRSAERLYAAGARSIRDVARMEHAELEAILTPKDGQLEEGHVATILRNATFEVLLHSV